MGRRRKSSGATISLFPFLSILACVIGTLTLMLIGLALGQMDTPDLADVETRDSAVRQAKIEVVAIESLTEKLAQKRKESTAAQRQIAEKKSEKLALHRKATDLEQQIKKAIEENKKPALPPQIPKIDEDKHRQRLAQIQKEIDGATDEIKKLQTQIANRDKPPEEAVVQIRPSGSGTNLQPTFVECTRGGLVIHQGEKPARIRRADLATSPPFLALLKRVAKSEMESVIFLIRDDAYSTYVAARAIAQRNYAKNGKLPVIGKGKIDLNIFQAN